MMCNPLLCLGLRLGTVFMLDGGRVVVRDVSHTKERENFL